MAIEHGRVEELFKRELEALASSYSIHTSDQLLTKRSFLLIKSQLINLEHRLSHILLVDVASFDRQGHVLFVVLHIEDFYSNPVVLSETHTAQNLFHSQLLVFQSDDIGLSTL